jgi:hypothetical protein
MIKRWIAVVVTLVVMVAVVSVVGVGVVVAGVGVGVAPSATPGALRMVVPRARGPPGRGRDGGARWRRGDVIVVVPRVVLSVDCCCDGLSLGGPESEVLSLRRHLPDVTAAVCGRAERFTPCPNGAQTRT